jgi:hypothetical protein
VSAPGGATTVTKGASRTGREKVLLGPESDSEPEEDIASLEKREQELSKFVREAPYTTDEQFASLRFLASDLQQQVKQLESLKKEKRASLTTENSGRSNKCIRPLRPDCRTKSDLKAGYKPFLVWKKQKDRVRMAARRAKQLPASREVRRELEEQWHQQYDDPQMAVGLYKVEVEGPTEGIEDDQPVEQRIEVAGFDREMRDDFRQEVKRPPWNSARKPPKGKYYGPEFQKAVGRKWDKKKRRPGIEARLAKARKWAGKLDSWKVPACRR